MRATSLSAVCVLWTCTCWADVGQPVQCILRQHGDDGWGLYGQSFRQVSETNSFSQVVKVPVIVTKEVQAGGKMAQKQFTEYRTEERQFSVPSVRLEFSQYFRPVNFETTKAYETQGRELSPADLKERCKGDTLVVVSTTGTMLPDYQAEAFKPGTIVFVEPVFSEPNASPSNDPEYSWPEAPIAPLDPRTSPKVPKMEQLQAASPQGQFAARTGIAAPRFPPTPPPEFVFVARDGADAIKIRQFREVKGELGISVQVNDSAVSPEKPLVVSQTLRNSLTIAVPMSTLRISQVKGGDLLIDRVKERLGVAESTVLVSGDGRLVDEFWLQNIKPGMLVVRGVQLPKITSPWNATISAPQYTPTPAPVKEFVIPEPPEPPEIK